MKFKFRNSTFQPEFKLILLVAIPLIYLFFADYTADEFPFKNKFLLIFLIIGFVISGFLFQKTPNQFLKKKIFYLCLFILFAGIFVSILI